MGKDAVCSGRKNKSESDGVGFQKKIHTHDYEHQPYCASHAAAAGKYNSQERAYAEFGKGNKLMKNWHADGCSVKKNSKEFTDSTNCRKNKGDSEPFYITLVQNGVFANINGKGNHRENTDYYYNGIKIVHIKYFIPF